MTQDKAPEWAEAKADKLLGFGWGKEMQGIRQTMHRDIAIALSQAYERGQESMRERAAGVSDKRAKMAAQVNHAAAVALLIALPDAIRSLPTEQEGGARK